MVKKFMFDFDFDHPGSGGGRAAEEEARQAQVQEAEPQPPPANMFSEEELSLARDAAFEEGRQVGLAESIEMVERQIASALTALSNHMDAVFRTQEQANDTNARNAVRVAMTVLGKVLPAACEKHAFEEVAKVVEECVAHILDEPRIIVRVAAGLVQPVRERLEAVVASQGFEGRVVIHGDARLAPGDCRVEWADGGAERDGTRLMQEIDAIVERALAPADQRRAEAPAEHEGAVAG